MIACGFDKKQPFTIKGGEGAAVDLKPSQALPRQIPPFVTCGDIFPPERGKSFLKGRAKPLSSLLKY